MISSKLLGIAKILNITLYIICKKILLIKKYSDIIKQSVKKPLKQYFNMYLIVKKYFKLCNT